MVIAQSHEQISLVLDPVFKLEMQFVAFSKGGMTMTCCAGNFCLMHMKVLPCESDN